MRGPRAGRRLDSGRAPPLRFLLRLVALALCALFAVACGAKPEPTSGKLDTTYPASVRDGSNRIITVEAPPRLVLVVTGGPERLLARLGVRAAVAPEDVTVARIRAAHPDLVVVGPGMTAQDEKRNETFIRELDVPVFVMPGARLPDIERGAVALGVLTNHAEAGRALALSLRRQREEIAQSLAAVAAADRLRRRGLRREHPAHDAARASARARRRQARRGRPTASRPSTPTRSTGSTRTPTSRRRRAA